MAPAPVCKYYLKGECRYGDRCKNEHPRNLPRNDNRFAAFQSPETPSRDSYGRGNNNGRTTLSQTPAFSLNRDVITADLSAERPQWILSAYGPGSKAPAQLFGGPIREQSFEEMRLHYYNGMASGNPELAIQQASALVQEAELQMRNALSNVDGAMDFIYKAGNEHPNRNDICQASTNALSSTGTISGSPSGANSKAAAQAASGFGQPSNLGAKPNPFGAPQRAFGQPSMSGSTGTFGQPSVLGQRPNPFGSQPGGVALAQGTGNTSGAFSAFAAKSNPFGTSAQPPVANPFGQGAAPTDNPFAQSGARPNPFGQPTSQSQPGFFGPAVTSTAFGAPSPAAQRNPFGTVSQTVRGSSSGPGVNQAPPSNLVGQPQPVSPSRNPFVQPAPTFSPNQFGQKPPSSGGSQSNPFTPSNQPPQTSVNGTGSQDPYRPNAQFHHPPLESYVSKDDNQRLRMFKGKPVVYKENEPGIQNRDGTWEKIWFPDGPPAYYGATELGDEAYTEDTKQAYLYMREKGSFKDGIMPLLPPKREWCLWDF